MATSASGTTGSGILESLRGSAKSGAKTTFFGSLRQSILDSDELNDVQRDTFLTALSSAYRKDLSAQGRMPENLSAFKESFNKSLGDITGDNNARRKAVEEQVSLIQGQTNARLQTNQTNAFFGAVGAEQKLNFQAK